MLSQALISARSRISSDTLCVRRAARSMSVTI